MDNSVCFLVVDSLLQSGLYLSPTAAQKFLVVLSATSTTRKGNAGLPLVFSQSPSSPSSQFPLLHHWLQTLLNLICAVLFTFPINKKTFFFIHSRYYWIFLFSFLFFFLYCIYPFFGGFFPPVSLDLLIFTWKTSVRSVLKSMCKHILVSKFIANVGT